MSKMMIAAAAASLCLAAGAAQAASPAPGYDDLDLGRPKDAQTYRMRLQRATDRICERENATGYNYAQRYECQARTGKSLMEAMPQDVRTIYLGALKGQASDKLARARLAASDGASSTSSR